MVGTSASGKSTLSRQLAKKLNLAYIELDDLFWQDNWQETVDAEFFQKIQHQIDLAENGYVIDGNYTRTIPVKWQNIDTVIWLDLPFHLNVLQAIKRALHRAIFQTKLWGSSNNTENFRQMFGRDSIVLWMVKTHHKNRKSYQEMMHHPDFSHIQFIHLRSRQQIQQFLEQVH